MPADQTTPYYATTADMDQLAKTRAALVEQNKANDVIIAAIDETFAKAAEMMERLKLLGLGAPDAKTKVFGMVTVNKPNEAMATAIKATVEPKAKPKPGKKAKHKLPRLTRGANGKLISFPVVIKEVVDAAEAGVSYSDIRDYILKGPLAEKMKQQPKGFYAATSRLIGDEGYVKYKGHLFTNQAKLDAFMVKVAAGDAEDLPDEEVVTTRKSPIGEAILELLAANTNGMLPKDIIDGLMTKPELNINPANKNMAYNMIKRLVDRRQIVKQGASYYLQNENDRPVRAGQTAEVGSLL